MEPTPVDQPPAKASLLQDWEIYRLRFGVPAWLRDNPGLVLTGVYVLTSLIGVIFNYFYFRRFRINVLEFSEASDFLMVVIRDPLTIALALLGIPFYVVYMLGAVAGTTMLRRRFTRLSSKPETLEKQKQFMRRYAGWVQLLFIGTYAILFVLLYSKYQSNKVRSSERYQVRVVYKTDVPPPSAVSASLIGTTGRYIFLYHPETRRSEAVPVESIAQMSWDARTKDQRAEDKAKAAEEIGK